MSDVTCPKCGDSEPIGHIVRGVYDGVLFWQCRCGHAWARFTNRNSWGNRLVDASIQHAADAAR